MKEAEKYVNNGCSFKEWVSEIGVNKKGNRTT